MREKYYMLVVCPYDRWRFEFHIIFYRASNIRINYSFLSNTFVLFYSAL